MLQEQASRKNTAFMKKQLIVVWDALLARNGVVAYMPIIVVTILMFCGASWQIFWPSTDAARYQCYALVFWLGGGATQLLPVSQCAFLHASTIIYPPFHMLPLEYPPLTLVIFSLSLLAPISYYQLVFALWMALTSMLIYWLLLRYGPRGAALTFALYALVGAWGTAEGRFDLVPAALTLLCVLAAERKHWTAAYIALAFGTLLKIYPLLLLPALFIAEQHAARRFHRPAETITLTSLPMELRRTLRGIGNWRWKNSLVFFSILFGVTAIFALLDFQGAVVSQLNYFAHRPVQIESTGSTILWIASQFGYPAHVDFTFGSLNIVSVLGNTVSSFFLLAFVLGYVYTIWLQWRGKLDVVQSFIALLLVFIATGKVFSPQYLIWVMPLLAYSCALDGFWLPFWGSISLLTTLIYPYLYTRTTNVLAVQYVPGFIQSVAMRDALFVLVTLAYLFNWLQVRKRKLLPQRRPGKETRPLLES
ncbi:MAG: DUF2029 domain-containing protein [Chloroflexi bacterium]|nr:MAG: DUF2029 domain-containing protein [Chloroflexota bacterium]